MARDKGRADGRRASGELVTPGGPLQRRESVLDLQRLAGNSAVASFLGSGDEGPRPERPSRALALRDGGRAPIAVQRDIGGHKDMQNGSFSINMEKQEGAAAAGEAGRVRFHPYRTSEASDSIKFIQIVRTDDTSDIDPAMITKKAKGQRGGFFVDQIATDLAAKAKKGQGIRPYYDVSGPPLAENRTGSRKGDVRKSAVLFDTPQWSQPQKFDFESSAKAEDTGFWYGTVRWGFEVFRANKAQLKVKGEYREFVEGHSKTTDQALNQFQDYYKSQGGSVRKEDRGAR